MRILTPRVDDNSSILGSDFITTNRDSTNTRDIDFYEQLKNNNKYYSVTANLKRREPTIKLIQDEFENDQGT
jgi:indole-3-glycerol phosphate synthase